ncbi:hypothetical protein AURDEDRAFT_177213 [Auricularia subglabra TFB-10046 SS5]|uniref:Uncharacterized protein n=1 Tax=Auricularia subglabra (strain TFB-10046 / SS5) TaxID=717982 RepID=J0D4M6_AURST|nr:hypothetical protein AURDEDRAFT_177213 [Auricularia subglabra TFB-10046 SS5]
MLTQNFITVVAGSSTPNDRGQVGPNARLEKREDRKHKDDFSLDTSELNAPMSPALCDLFNDSPCVDSIAFEDMDRETGALEAAVMRFAQTNDWEPTPSTWFLSPTSARPSNVKLALVWGVMRCIGRCSRSSPHLPDARRVIGPTCLASSAS